MPYIQQAEREWLDETTLVGLCEVPLEAGQLNYVISTLLTEQLRRNFSYAEINEVIGVLECAKLELYRRQAVPYEDKKIALNGDI